MGQIIYEPKGRAGEYAELACNLFTGCSHGCQYCYARSLAARYGRLEKFLKPEPRKNWEKMLNADCKKLAEAKDKREILFCFTCDPFMLNASDEIKTTIIFALEIVADYGLNATVLTKGGAAAYPAFPILDRYGWSFGTSIVFESDRIRKHYEPNSASVTDRVTAIIKAKEIGIKTWVSLEPVIDPSEALVVIDTLHEYVDHWKIGKINYNAELEKNVDWPKFKRDAINLLDHYGADYYIKNSLKDL